MNQNAPDESSPVPDPHLLNIRRLDEHDAARYRGRGRGIRGTSALGATLGGALLTGALLAPHSSGPGSEAPPPASPKVEHPLYAQEIAAGGIRDVMTGELLLPTGTQLYKVPPITTEGDTPGLHTIVANRLKRPLLAFGVYFNPEVEKGWAAVATPDFNQASIKAAGKNGIRVFSGQIRWFRLTDEAGRQLAQGELEQGPGILVNNDGSLIATTGNSADTTVNWLLPSEWQSAGAVPGH